ncbi:MAG: hypothetical protein SPJ27_04555 [Candidatus Onthovivens sp.]|nr:hypothetical protein [Candidatus Onthovivens sp.]
MNWNEIGTQVILGIIGLIISGLGAIVTYLINKYIKNDKLKSIMNSLDELVGNGVLAVYQTYVEALKKDGIFDEIAQKNAYNKCLELINKNMSTDVKKWLVENKDNIDDYLKDLIEAKIASLKNNSKK